MRANPESLDTAPQKKKRWTGLSTGSTFKELTGQGFIKEPRGQGRALKGLATDPAPRWSETSPSPGRKASRGRVGFLKRFLTRRAGNTPFPSPFPGPGGHSPPEPPLGREDPRHQALPWSGEVPPDNPRDANPVENFFPGGFAVRAGASAPKPRPWPGLLRWLSGQHRRDGLFPDDAGT